MQLISEQRIADRQAGVTVAIATFGRERVLVETIEAVLALQPSPRELLVLDQTPEHETATEAALSRWHQAGAIRWLRLEQPSITKAMNQALLLASQPLVLFLDDDVVPDRGLVAAHESAYADRSVWAVVGQVLQPGQQVVHVDVWPQESGLRRDLAFPFNCDFPCPIYSCIGCNLSVDRDRALSIGGFDENFGEVAYRFEAEFARRVWRSGGRLVFDPAASIKHLQTPRGGTRAYGNHLRSMRPAHSVGDYYFALSQGVSAASLGYCLNRFIRSATTRFHLTHPWWIAPKLVGELRGMSRAVGLAIAGPKLFRPPVASTIARPRVDNEESRQPCSGEPLS